VSSLRAVWSGGPSDQQLNLAKAASIKLSARLPRPVAAARLRIGLRHELALGWEYEASDGEISYMTDLATSLGVSVPNCWARSEVRAWVEALRAKQRMQALGQLKLRSGDIVELSTDPGSIEEVASIGLDGSVYMRGVRRAWPDTITVLARAKENSAASEALRRQAKNNAALRSRRRAPSLAMADQLSDFACPEGPTSIEVDELERLVEAASDERPLQTYLQATPNLLGALMRGPDRFVLSQVQLGKHYVADFFLADIDSSGIRWVMVELETPRSDSTLKTSRQFDKFARKGLSQIHEWREWLQNNLDHARRPRAQGGLGLIDIRPQVDGLMLVGRRHRLGKDAAALRRQEAETSRVAVHTYDWLVEHVRGASEFVGPPGANRYLIQDLPSATDSRS
jgi:hypothetical protein